MRLLIVGSMDGQIGAASSIAIDRGAKVSHVPSISAALNLLRSGKGADLLMIDASLDISDLCKSLKEERINTPVVAYGMGTDKDMAVKAIKSGAKEYIPLPPEADLIAAVLEAVSEETHNLLFKSDSMKKMIDLADQIAPSNASILITGESGTGKEVLSRYIHRHSKRNDKPFISLNCAAIPENLLESELFGHEKGSFTGAITRRIGKFEEANGGTLLLDEISELHPRLQAKLLRAIQEREIDRVGGNKPIKVNIRLLATSNRDLETEVKNGNFREDLLFRLNVLNIKLPSLKDRIDDIEILSEYFIEKYSTANGISKKSLSELALSSLKNYAWPGNVRELENTMHRAVLLSNTEEIEPDAILLQNGKSIEDKQKDKTSSDSTNIYNENDEDSTLLVGRTVAEVEKELILDTLDHCLGNRTHAAKILGISIRTLRNKLKIYTQAGMEPASSNDTFRAA